MSERTQRMRSRILKNGNPVCIEKYRISVETVLNNPNDAPVLRQSKILSEVCRRMPIFIMEDELLVGNGASKPYGMEVSQGYGSWNREELELLRKDGFPVSKKDEEELIRLNTIYHSIGSAEGINLAVSSSPRLENYVQTGIMLPAWKKPDAESENRWGGGRMQTGIGPDPGWGFYCLDYGMVLGKGLEKLIDECEEELQRIIFFDADTYMRSLTLQSMQIGMQGIIAFANRFSKLAAEMAETETRAWRKAELMEISQICSRVPAKPARTFREALQMFWFIFLCAVMPNGAAALGRMDQFLYPYYKADIEAGRITDEQVIELFECLRIKCMEQECIQGFEARKKQSGKAKWLTMTLGGVKPDGSDASNELTIAALEAMIRCQTPHHTISLRVAESTPDAVMKLAVKAQALGLSMPSFVGDNSFITFFQNAGASLEEARDYCICGCNDGVIVGKSLRISVNLVIPIKMFEIWLNNGVDPRTGLRVCDQTGDLERFEDFDDFYAAFIKSMHYMERLSAERVNIENMVLQTFYPGAIPACFMTDGIRQGKPLFSMDSVTGDLYSISPVGMIDLSAALYNIRKLVYEEKELTLTEFKKILDEDWNKHEELRLRCKAFNKYGNNIEDIDSLATRLYKDWADGVDQIPCGNRFARSAAVSITAYDPAGAITGATPDGRHAGEILTDACASPSSGADKNGFLAVLQSALKLPQDRFSSFLLNQKLHPSLLKNEDDWMKLASTIKVYMKNGGKHIQFNVIDRKTMLRAQEHPDDYENLMVRVAGYSAYFVILSRAIQDQLIDRTLHEAY